MSIRPLLAAWLVLASVSGVARSDETKQQDVQRLREENVKLRELQRRQAQALREVEQALERIRKENLQLITERNEERMQRIQGEIQLKARTARNLELESQIREMARELARAKAGAGGGTVLKKRGAANPPSENVEGRVKAVDKESGLISISAGSDAGLKQGHTLEVFRLSAKPQESKYLGRVEILTVRPGEAVARFLAKPAVPVEPGDRVTSRLQGPEKK